MTTRVCYVFGPFEFDPGRRRLVSAGELLALSDRQCAVLHLLVAKAGHIVSKDDLLNAGWNDVAVGDNSLEQVISSLRRVLARGGEGSGYIETVPRRGYRFADTVTRAAARETDAGLEALLAPHRAFVEGRAALETLEPGKVARARAVFESALERTPEYPSAHLGLANACVMQFEMTRSDLTPDRESLQRAAHHAREACRLDPQSGEAWATLGFVLDRMGDALDGKAAATRAVTLEPDNWRHHFRLASVSWGEARLRAAHRTLALLPSFPLAHWLAATVHVARQALGEAERELRAGITGYAGQSAAGARFHPVALHWTLGLILLTKGDEAEALREFEAELSFESTAQLYTREVAAHTCYAIGTLRLRQGRRDDARTAFAGAIARVPSHAMARLALAAAEQGARMVPRLGEGADARAGVPPVDRALLQGAISALAGDHARAARVVEEALSGAAPGSAGWILPIEPLIGVGAHAALWAGALAQLRNRAA